MNISDYEAQEFIHEIIEELISPMFGDESNSLYQNKQLAIFLEAMCELHALHRYDLAKCDFESMSHICEQVLFYIEQLRAHPNQHIFIPAHELYLKLETAARATWVFVSLEADVPVPSNFEARDISAITGLKTSTLRNVLPAAFSDDYDKRRESLAKSNRLPKIIVYDSDNETDEIELPVESSIEQWLVRLKRRAEGREVSWEALTPLLPNSTLNIDTVLDWCLGSPESVIILADKLSINRASFIKNTVAMLEEMVQTTSRHAIATLEHASQATPSYDAKSDNTVIDATGLRDLIITNFNGHLHSRYRGNKKLIGMMLENGNTIAIETSKTPQIWINADNYDDRLQPFVVKRYPETSEEQSLYQRHSGLRLYQSLGTSDVVKLRIKTFGNARQVIEIVSKA